MKQSVLASHDVVGVVLDFPQSLCCTEAAILFNDYLAATHGADQDKMVTRNFIRASTSFKPSQEYHFTGLEDDTASNDSDSDSDESDSSDRAGGSRKKPSSAQEGQVIQEQL